MNPFVVKAIFRPAIRKATQRGLVGRNRDRKKPNKGRFTPSEADKILKRAWCTYDQLAPLVPHEPKPGNQMNMLLACLTLGCFQALIESGIERKYAIELIGDIAWKVYEKWGRLPIFIARMSSRDPRERIKMSVNLFLQFPFTPPGYIFERLPTKDGISLDMRRCPVAEYFQKQDEADLCLGTWCNLDFALAEMWGGWLERTETLAEGYLRCDFRFKAKTVHR